MPPEPGKPRTPPELAKEQQAKETNVMVYESIEVMLGMQRRMETQLCSLVEGQQAIASVLRMHNGQPQDYARPQKDQVGRILSNITDGTAGDSEQAISMPPLSPTTSLSRQTIILPQPGVPVSVQGGFLAKLAEAEASIGRQNLLKPSEAKEFLDKNPGTLFLDVSEREAPPVPGTYRIPLAEVFFKASADLHDMKDPTLADRKKDEPIIVTCTRNGIAKLASKILLDYGFNNVKIMDGGNLAWKVFVSANPVNLPANWPACIRRRPWWDEEWVMQEIGRATTGGVPNLDNFTPLDTRHRTVDEVSLMGALTSIKTSRTSSRGTGSRNSWGSTQFVLSPSSPLRMSLDVASILVLIFDLITVPWYLAWDVSVEGWLSVASMFVVSFWTVDILVNFRTGFFQNGELYMDSRMIARRYLRSWFIPDITMVAIDWGSQLFTMLGSGGETSSIEVRAAGILRLAKWSRLLRFFSMARLMRFSHVFERVVDFSYHSPGCIQFLQVLRLLFIIFYINHFTACLWWAIGRLADSNNNVRWIHGEVNDLGITYEEADRLYQYMLSLHWAMTQIIAGSMNVQATNSFEHGFTVACLIFGVLFLSSLVSTLAAKMTQLRMMQKDRSAKIAQLREFLRRKAISADLAVNIIKQVDEALQDQKPALTDELSAYSALSQRNKMELHRELCKPQILQHPFFVLVGHVKNKMVKQLCDKAVRLVLHKQEDIIFTSASEAPDAYYILNGHLKYTQEPDTSMVEAEREQHLVQSEWISEASLWMQWTHVGTLEAVKPTELLVLEAHKVGEVFHHNSQVSHIASEFSRIYNSRMQQAKPPYAEWPNDVHVPFTSFQEVVVSMHEQSRVFISELVLQSKLASLTWTSWNQRLRDDVSSGRVMLTMTPSGHVEVVVSAVQLQLERIDGTLLVQVGTWGPEGLVPGCALPKTVLQPGEVPKQAFHRMLSEQLSVVNEEDLCIQKSSTHIENSAESHLINRRTTVVTYNVNANVDWADDEFPTATAASTTFVSTMPSFLVHKMSSASMSVSAAAVAASLPTADEVYIVAGRPDSGDLEDDDQPVLRLFTWLLPQQLDLLKNKNSALKKFLGPLLVTPEAAEEAKDLYSAANCPRETHSELLPDPKWQSSFAQALDLLLRGDDPAQPARMSSVGSQLRADDVTL